MKTIKILLLDNDESQIKLNREFLRGGIEKVNITVSKNIKSALDILNKKEFDVVIIKHSPPVLNSLLVLEKLREKEKCSVPIVLMKRIDKNVIENLIRIKCRNYLVTSRHYYQHLPRLVLDCIEKSRLIQSREILEKEHKNQIQKLETCKNYFEGWVNATNFIIYTIDKELKITGINKAFRNFIKFNNLSNKTDFLNGIHLLNLLKLDDEHLKNCLNQLLNDKKMMCYYEFTYNHNEEKKFYDMLINPIKNDKREITGLVFLTKDITANKLLENKLKESELNYRTLIQNIDEVIFRSDESGNIIWFNSAAEKVFGASIKKLSLSPTKLSGLVYPDDYEMVKSALEKYYMEAKSSKTELEFRIIPERKKILWFHLILYPLLDDNNKFTGLEGVGQDITEKKEAETKEQELELELQNKSKLASIGELAAGIAHEINNPLGALTGGIEVLKEKLSNNFYLSENLNKLGKLTERIGRIVDGLLYLSRQNPLKKKPANINIIIEEALETFRDSIRNNSISQKKSVRITKSLIQTLPEVAVEEDQIAQVFLNLLKNAYDAISDKGTIFITSSLSKDGQYVLIKFKDTGVGIPKKNLDKIFLPFFTTKDVDKGTGLGLSICDGIIRAHGGDIEVESKVGIGSTFTVKLSVNS